MTYTYNYPTNSECTSPLSMNSYTL
uniref:Uncharacterized protein n=1 Tax=Lepeophtheirus salmonis TaxID=72036 RepID=A0A0K2UY64_LEPSM